MPRSRKARAKRAPHRRSAFTTHFLIPLLLFATLIGLGYVAYLDFTVRSRFEGTRWSLPARVYARPLELYAGANLSAEFVEQELAMLHFRKVGDPATPGTYRRDGDGALTLVTRDFTFWDGKETSQRVQLRFHRGQVVDMSGGNGQPLGIVRLDPLVIGGIYPAHNEDRVLVQLAEVPKQLTDTLLAVEDRNFHAHHGVSLRAISRALYANLRAGGTVQGGSTLTQQLVKNFYLSNQRTLSRKLNEAVMALLLDWHYTKDEILEAYLNEVYLGQDGARAIHGFGLASRFYFERPLNELRLPQYALLVGLVKGPSYYDPRRNPERAKQRRNLVLDVLAELNMITPAEAHEAKNAELGVTPRAGGSTAYPAFIDLVKRQLRAEYQEQDLTSAGLQVFTTLDPLAQASAERALTTRIRNLEKSRRLPAGKLQGAAIISSVEGGEVQAVVGGRDPRLPGFNRALDAVRQIGSLVKPAVYLTALAQHERYNLISPLDDSALRVRNHDGSYWTPQNYDKRDHGLVNLLDALAHSYNVSTARLGLEVGLPKVINTLRALGVERDIKAYPSLLLGAQSMTPIEVAQMYQTIAGAGFRIPLRAIREVLTVDGQPLQRYGLSVRQAVDPAPVFVLNRAMQAVVTSGTAASLGNHLSRDLNIAGKTGTTDDTRDSWFAGYSGDRLAVVWLGLDDNASTGLTGASGALQVWGDMLSRLPLKPVQMTQPAAIEFRWVDPYSRMATDAECPGSVQLPFIAGSTLAGFQPCYGRPGGRGQPVEKAFEWFRGIFQ